MKEKELIKVIQKTLNSEYIGDDCAYLKDLGITISQDNLVEDVHFSLKYTSPYQLGYKSAMVNISDIAASGAEPKYLTVGLSLPKNITNEFVEEFFKGMKSSGVEVVGGDITGSEKIVISVTAIGYAGERKISSRSNAKPGYKVIVSGNHGSSAAGLKCLFAGKQSKFIENHLMPKARVEFSKYVAENIKTDYAMMDTSDGLYDALNQIAEASKVLMDIDFKKIPYDKDIEAFEDYKELILYGGEDYELVACVPEEFNVPYSFKIGSVKEGLGVIIDGNKTLCKPNLIFDHFKEKK